MIGIDMKALTGETALWLASERYVELAQRALEMRESSYCPYSGFAVGAALLTEEGRVYTGCNIENAAYSVTVCAERTALFKAVSEGERRFSAIAVAGGKAGGPAGGLCTPCGVCRQALREFCGPDFALVCPITDEKGTLSELRIYTLDELLPDSFGPDDLGR